MLRMFSVFSSVPGLIPAPPQEEESTGLYHRYIFRISFSHLASSSWMFRLCSEIRDIFTQL